MNKQIYANDMSCGNCAMQNSFCCLNSAATMAKVIMQHKDDVKLVLDVYLFVKNITYIIVAMSSKPLSNKSNTPFRPGTCFVYYVPILLGSNTEKKEGMIAGHWMESSILIRVCV